MKHDAGYILFGRVQESFTNQTTPEHPGMKRMGHWGCSLVVQLLMGVSLLRWLICHIKYCESTLGAEFASKASAPAHLYHWSTHWATSQGWTCVKAMQCWAWVNCSRHMGMDSYETVFRVWWASIDQLFCAVLKFRSVSGFWPKRTSYEEHLAHWVFLLFP
jgi:hypothetical protein